MTEICQSLCEDSKLIGDIIDHLLQIWTRCLPYEERNGSKYASITPLVGSCILYELFSNNQTESTEKVFVDNFEKLFSALLIRISNSLSNIMPQPKANNDYSDSKGQKNLPKPQNPNDFVKINPIKLTFFLNFYVKIIFFDYFKLDFQ